MKSGSMSAFEAARNIDDAIDGYDGPCGIGGLEGMVDWVSVNSYDAMPPDDESYHAHIRSAALACHCCPVCCSPPCDGCLAGGVCDDAACRCDELDEYRREDDQDA